MIVTMKQLHVKQVAELENICFSRPYSEDMLKDELNDPNTLYLVEVLPSGQVRGYAGLKFILDEGHITNVAVAPEYRRQGIGDALLERLIELSGSLGLKSLMLEVRVSNAGARAMYEKHGFETVGMRPGYYFDPEEDAVLMTLKIAPT